ncbi:hypothetical protein ACFSTA_00175 [Ornithinibacillus salinisoli]|uniref:DUF3953 domain-containing protein n=1 Tax=Ornithinibacillus salinisoli TaxID=1848459 RepID=A0ABW4VWP7_9BACI
MKRIISISLSFIVVILGIFILITKNFSLTPICLLFVSLLLFDSGVNLLIKKRRAMAYTYFLIAGFNIVVSFNILFT